MKTTLGIALVGLLAYAIWSAIIAEWARATFFLVAYRIGWDVSALIRKAKKMAAHKYGYQL